MRETIMAGEMPLRNREQNKEKSPDGRRAGCYQLRYYFSP
jgi:hypothetical protein